MKIELANTRQHVWMFLLLGGAVVGCVAAAAVAIQNVPSAPQPKSVAGSTEGLLSPGFLSTSGNQIVDSTGHPQRLACVGFNEPSKDIAGAVNATKKAPLNCFCYSNYERAFPSKLAEIDGSVAASI